MWASPEKRIYLGVEEPTGVQESFVHAFRVDAIKAEEYVDDAKLGFTVVTDVPIAANDWADLWVRAQRNGLGASRSQGYGTFEVTVWEQIADADFGRVHKDGGPLPKADFR